MHKIDQLTSFIPDVFGAFVFRPGGSSSWHCPPSSDVLLGSFFLPDSIGMAKELPPSVSLPDDGLFEILSRVPYRSLCRFKCVSRPWLALCSNPDIRKRSPQTLSGFFCHAMFAKDAQDGLRFVNLVGRGRPLVDPSLRFLGDYERIELVDCSGGLLLCRCYRPSSLHPDYVVCNPATEKWTALPATEALHPVNNAIFRLGFDPAVPSHFEVFLLERSQDSDRIAGGVQIYSSKTGEWTSAQSQWHGNPFPVDTYSACVFFDGTLHLITYDYDNYHSSLATVDSEGKIWRIVPMPDGMQHENNYGCIGQSRGRLYVMYIVGQGSILEVWVLEDYGSGQWTLKHTANVLELLGRHHHSGTEYTVIAIHRERNLIFLTNGEGNTLLSYDMDDRKVQVICSIGEHFPHLFAPYIPCFAEWLSDGH